MDLTTVFIVILLIALPLVAVVWMELHSRRNARRKGPRPSASRESVSE